MCLSVVCHTFNFNLEDFDPECVKTEINNELEKVNLWLKLHKLSLNIKKTKLMIFHRKQKKIKDINISIDNVQIERVNTFNFLGILLDESLTWTKITQTWLLIIFDCNRCSTPTKEYFSKGNINNIIQHINTVIHKLWTISLGCEIQ